jgi:hypothetical protein
MYYNYIYTDKRASCFGLSSRKSPNSHLKHSCGLKNEYCNKDEEKIVIDRAIRVCPRERHSPAFFPFDTLRFKDIGDYLLDNMLPDIDLPP